MRLTNLSDFRHSIYFGLCLLILYLMNDMYLVIKMQALQIAIFLSFPWEFQHFVFDNLDCTKYVIITLYFLCSYIKSQIHVTYVTVSLKVHHLYGSCRCDLSMLFNSLCLQFT